MTGYFGTTLYVMALAIAVWFLRRVSGQSFAEILNRRSREHHRVMAVFEEHPRGGSWRDYRRWEGLGEPKNKGRQGEAA